jgi:hypothetical protein
MLSSSFESECLKGVAMQVRVKHLKHASAAVTFSFFIAGHAALAQAQTSGNGVLKQVADVPLPGPAVWFDYQSLDAEHKRLYMGPFTWLDPGIGQSKK